MENPTAYTHVHEETVKRVNEIMPGEEELFDHKDPHTLCALRVGYVRVRHSGALGHDPVGHLSPAGGAEKGEAGAV